MKRIPEDGGGDRVVGASVEEDDEVVSGPGVLVQVDLHLDPLQGRVHRLHLRDRVLWVQDLNDRHVDASKVGLLMKYLPIFTIMISSCTNGDICNRINLDFQNKLHRR